MAYESRYRTPLGSFAKNHDHHRDLVVAFRRKASEVARRSLDESVQASMALIDWTDRMLLLSLHDPLGAQAIEPRGGWEVR
ncbi:hypothetical protein [Bradyrhizobium brasilense]|uniref:hypothetical protein n=1 Tax=Bradyrhizobium brasilense TaxID=1419277 RepID=UPI00115F9FD5|nr:hypothetical protein [Bradyrhizobium brasilense]